MLRIASDPEDVLIFVGDFNLPDVEWAVDTDNDSILIPTKFSPEPTAIFVKGLLDMGVNQVNHVRNENAKFLDLFFTNDYTNVTIERVDQSNALKKKIEGHHPPILATFEWHGVDSTEPVTTEAFNFKRANFSEMNAYLATIDFAALFDGKTIAEKVNILHDILDKVIEKFVPKIKIKSIQKCPWKNRELITLKNRKNKAGKRFRQSGRKPCFEWQYILASREFEKLNNELYDAYVTKMKESLKHDPSRFWQYVNSKKSTDNKPKIMQLGDVRTDNEAEQANLFAEFFSSNYDDSLMQGDSNSPSDEPRLNEDFQLDINFVIEELNAVNIKKGTGPDGMHPLILKHCASHLAAPLTQIFNESLSTGHFPDKWKRSSVSPIFKKGARSKIENYRCIAKLQTVAKFFEHLVNVKLLSLVQDKITKKQHGFMKSRSTASNLTEFVYYAQRGINSGAQVDVLYTDFSKAFDRVNHKRLILKLRSFNLPDNLLAWLESYLSNRTQFVKYGASESNEFIVSSGVPQGSHLGPTLFLLFINDIVDEMDDVFISLFADDVKIAKIITCQEDAVVLQQAIDKLRAWCDANTLHLNLDKCAVLTVTTKKKDIFKIDYMYGTHKFKHVSEHKDLGVLIDQRLSFNQHIDMITSKATAALGFIRRFCYDITDVQTLKSLYYALVQSHLEYCNVVWLPTYAIHIAKIESVQKRFTQFARREYRTAANGFNITSYAGRLEALNMTSLHRRRVNASVVFMYDIVKGNANCSTIRNDIAVGESVRVNRFTPYLKNKISLMENRFVAQIPQL
ncbi:reverse transcriptase, partial [Pyrenophora tritici-repentis]